MSKTPWKIDAKVSEAINEMVAERLKLVLEATELAQTLGNACNDKPVVVVEMAIGVMLAHIIDGYPRERRQEVFDRFINHVLELTE